MLLTVLSVYFEFFTLLCNFVSLKKVSFKIVIINFSTFEDINKCKNKYIDIMVLMLNSYNKFRYNIL